MKNILIVDDNKDIAEVYCDRLAIEGFNVVVINNPEKALEQIQKSKPDLILLDIIMPGLKGPELYEKIKASPETKEIKIAFMTAYASLNTPWGNMTTEKHIRELGADEFLRKEMPLEKFVDAIKNLLEEKQ